MQKKLAIVLVAAGSLSLGACGHANVMRNGPLTTYENTSFMGHAMVSTLKTRRGHEKVVAATHSEGPGSLIMKGAMNAAGIVAGSYITANGLKAAARATQAATISINNSNQNGGTAVAGSSAVAQQKANATSVSQAWTED